MSFVIAHKVEILAALLAVSEVMALVPSLKSSGIFDLIYRAIKAAAGK